MKESIEEEVLVDDIYEDKYDDNDFESESEIETEMWYPVVFSKIDVLYLFTAFQIYFCIKSCLFVKMQLWEKMKFL